MINVCCVFWGSKFQIKYVNVLHDMVQRHLTVPHKFICFTDNRKRIKKEVECRDIPMPGFSGWWNKMLLFTKEAQLEGNSLYFDLDVVICANIDKFVQGVYEDEKVFGISRDFGQPDMWFNSSIMKFNNKYHTMMIWDKYINDKRRYDNLHGDQNVISDIMRNKEDTKPFPDDWSFSYKWPQRGAPQTYQRDKEYSYVDGASVSIFHGGPKPHEVDTQWVVDNWRESPEIAVHTKGENDNK
jgi:hypothetical protein